MRRPRSPSPWRASATPRARSAWKTGKPSSGVAQTVTGPIPAATAVAALAERDILHQRDFREPARCLEGIAPHEDRLVAGRDPGEPRAQVHQPADDGEQRRAAGDRDVEAAPGAARPLEAIEHDVVG